MQSRTVDGMSEATHGGDAGRRLLRQCLVNSYGPCVPTPRKTPQHTVVVDDDLWQTARRIAELRREKISDVIRQALLRYVQRHKHLLPDD